MFLLVFVTFVISILGLYAQVLAVQTSKINHAQYGMMQTMLAWHNSAVSLVKSPVVNHENDPVHAVFSTPLPCIIGINPMPSPLPNPPVPLAPLCSFNAVPLVLSGPSVPTPLAPVGYNFSPYTFYSVLYNTVSPASYYILTYVFAKDPGTGDLQIPDAGDTTVGYSMNDLIQQFSRAAPPNVSYGQISIVGGQDVLTVSAKSSGITTATGKGLTYPIPGVNIPAGAFAVLSVVN